MKVEPEVVHHPKFLRLKKLLADRPDYAMEALVRLWGHCENSQRGEFWKGKDGDYLEIVCEWPGAQGGLFAALKTAGWVEEEARGIRIHDWAAHNWRRVSNWELGRRPKRSHAQASGKPKLHQGSANEEPNGSRTDLNELNEEREKEREKSGSGEPIIEHKAAAATGGEGEAKALRVQFAALRAQIQDLEQRREELTAAELGELGRLRGKLSQVQKRQGEGAV